MENKKLEEQIKSIMYVAVGAIATIAERQKNMQQSLKQKAKKLVKKLNNKVKN